MVKTTFLLSAGVLLSFLPSVEATRNRWVNMPDDHTGWAQISDGDCCFTHDRFGTAVKDRCPYYGYWGGWDDGYYGYGRGDAWWIVDGKYARARKPAGDKDKLEMCTGGELRQAKTQLHRAERENCVVTIIIVVLFVILMLCLCAFCHMRGKRNRYDENMYAATAYGSTGHPPAGQTIARVVHTGRGRVILVHEVPAPAPAGGQTTAAPAATTTPAPAEAQSTQQQSTPTAESRASLGAESCFSAEEGAPVAVVQGTPVAGGSAPTASSSTTAFGAIPAPERAAVKPSWGPARAGAAAGDAAGGNGGGKRQRKEWKK